MSSRMAYTAPRGDQTYAPSGGHRGLRADAREPGARRRRLAGYLKAANDIRQSYFAGDPSRDSHHAEDGPAAFPDAAVVRSGREEMILFPGYARRHVSRQPQAAATPGRDMTEEEYWQREWSQHEDVTAVVDVDVRGWIYTPPRGPHTRKQRMVIGLARQLSGIPAPSTTRPAGSNPSSAPPSRAPSPTSQQDEQLIHLEAENMVRRGQQEQSCASRGAFSEDTDSLYGDAANQAWQRRSYASSIASQDSDSAAFPPPQKRNSWQRRERMTETELTVANTHLLTRLRPFMAIPLANTPISAFFYNESASRQQTVYTDASGHFSLRAALDFIPTHVRVLAGEKLSATEEVIITAPQGVSLISDIDDTIKHSAISSGAREIFRNALIRELGELTIEGVREWYTTLQDMGVKLHYVSNSPWQMYPVLTSFFKLANLPQGSFHLKQYSGMLQGIFEPVAERKKSSLEKIMRDFPDRKFILVGDSGEADLEVYTETAMDNPGKILGIFIRDVTTPTRTGYSDPNTSPGSSGRHSRNHSRHKSGDALAQSKRLSRPNDIKQDDADLQAAIAASLRDMEEETRRARRSINPDSLPFEVPESPRRGSGGSGRPNLLTRPPVKSSYGERIAASPEEDLIDFTDPPPARPWLEPPQRKTSPTNGAIGQRPSPSPPPPPKPVGLRSPPSDQQLAFSSDSAHKTPPPRPRKPSSAVKPNNLPQIQAHQPSPLSQVQRQESTRKPPPPLPARRNLKGTIAKAIPLPSNGGYWQSEAPMIQTRPRTSRAASKTNSTPTSPLALARPMTSAKSFEDLNLPTAAMNQPAPPPPRRNATAYSTATIRPSTNPLSGNWDDDGLPGSPGDGMSKKEYLWQQRWARAKIILESNGVTLRSWKVGSDVADVCVKLVEMELRKIEKEQRKSQGNRMDTPR